MRTFNDIIQGSDDWFRIRAGRPSASNFKRILTPTGKKSESWETYALELIDQCIRPKALLNDPAFAGNRHTDRGNELEPIAREEFAQAFPMFDVQTVGFITRDDEVIGCSPDSLIYQNGKLIAGHEIKCPEGPKHARDLIFAEGRKGNDRLPDEHIPQVHGGMAVTGLGFWYYTSFCPGYPPLIVRVERDAYTKMLSKALDEFLIFYAERRKQYLPILAPKRKERAA